MDVEIFNEFYEYANSQISKGNVFTDDYERHDRKPYFYGGAEYTLEEIGKQLGIARERVRHIECKALRMLKHPRRSVLLRDFL